MFIVFRRKTPVNWTYELSNKLSRSVDSKVCSSLFSRYIYYGNKRYHSTSRKPGGRLWDYLQVRSDVARRHVRCFEDKKYFWLHGDAVVASLDRNCLDVCPNTHATPVGENGDHWDRSFKENRFSIKDWMFCLHPHIVRIFY